MTHAHTHEYAQCTYVQMHMHTNAYRIMMELGQGLSYSDHFNVMASNLKYFILRWNYFHVF